MASDDPPFLELGTEVSAKYRGAFCEAKVKTVDRCVRVKVNAGKGSAIVVDHDAVKEGPLKLGGKVVIKAKDGVLVSGTVTKLNDASVYTVVFDDGDERTLKRSSLVLKGGRHYNESETLDTLPLTNPECFGSPRQSRKRGKPTPPREGGIGPGTTTSPKRRKPPPQRFGIGQVVFMENDRRKASWLPAVVVPSAIVTGETESGAEPFYVRSFRDGRFYGADSKDLHEFSESEEPLKGILSGDLYVPQSHKAGIDRAVSYIQSGQLPWDMELSSRDGRVSLFSSFPRLHLESSPESNTEAHEEDEPEDNSRVRDTQRVLNPNRTATTDDVDSSNRWDRSNSLRDIDLGGDGPETVSDTLSHSVGSVVSDFREGEGCDSGERGRGHVEDSATKIEIEKLFMDTLSKFHRGRGTPIIRHPVVGQKSVDLLRLYRMVHEYGGMEKVTKSLKWRQIYLKMGLPPNQTNCSSAIKHAYNRYLMPFRDSEECRMFQEGLDHKGMQPVLSGHSTPVRSPVSIATPPAPSSMPTPLVPPRECLSPPKQSRNALPRHGSRSFPSAAAEEAGEQFDHESLPRTRSHTTASATAASPTSTAALPHQQEGAKRGRTPSSSAASLPHHHRDDPAPVPAKGNLIRTEDDTCLTKGDPIDSKRRSPADTKRDPFFTRDDLDGTKDALEPSKMDPPGTKEEIAVDLSGVSGEDLGDNIEEEEEEDEGCGRVRKPFSVGDKIAVVYGKGKAPSKYEAKIIDETRDKKDGSIVYHVHYNGWNNRYNEWIPASRIVAKVDNFSFRQYYKKKPSPKGLPDETEKGEGKEGQLSEPSSSPADGRKLKKRGRPSKILSGSGRRRSALKSPSSLAHQSSLDDSVDGSSPMGSHRSLHQESPLSYSMDSPTASLQDQKSFASLDEVSLPSPQPSEPREGPGEEEECERMSVEPPSDSEDQPNRDRTTAAGPEGEVDDDKLLGKEPNESFEEGGRSGPPEDSLSSGKDRKDGENPVFDDEEESSKACQEGTHNLHVSSSSNSSSSISDESSDKSAASVPLQSAAVPSKPEPKAVDEKETSSVVNSPSPQSVRDKEDSLDGPESPVANKYEGVNSTAAVFPAGPKDSDEDSACESDSSEQSHGPPASRSALEEVCPEKEEEEDEDMEEEKNDKEKDEEKEEEEVADEEKRKESSSCDGEIPSTTETQTQRSEDYQSVQVPKEEGSIFSGHSSSSQTRRPALGLGEGRKRPKRSLRTDEEPPRKRIATLPDDAANPWILDFGAMPDMTPSEKIHEILLKMKEMRQCYNELRGKVGHIERKKRRAKRREKELQVVVQAAATSFQ